MDVDIESLSPEIPQGRGTCTEDGIVNFELAPAALQTSTDCLAQMPQPTPQDRQEDGWLKSVLENLDNLADAISGVEARLLSRLQSEDKVTALQKEVAEKCIPKTMEHPLPSLLHPYYSSANLILPLDMLTPEPMSYWHEQEPDVVQTDTSAALRDISPRANAITISPAFGGYIIPAEVLNLALQACRSRRNLAAWLGAEIITLQERLTIICRGNQGRTALDGEKLKAIFTR